jgi:hypothetical protein
MSETNINKYIIKKVKKISSGQGSFPEPVARGAAEPIFLRSGQRVSLILL